MKTYEITDFVGDRKSLKKYIESTFDVYEFPCKLNVSDDQGIREYYAEESNIMGNGIIVLDWKYIII